MGGGIGKQHSGPPPPLVKLQIVRGGPEFLMVVDLVYDFRVGFDVSGSWGWVDLG
jgi:hypothetical protein